MFIVFCSQGPCLISKQFGGSYLPGFLALNMRDFIFNSCLKLENCCPKRSRFEFRGRGGASSGARRTEQHRRRLMTQALVVGPFLPLRRLLDATRRSVGCAPCECLHPTSRRLLNSVRSRISAGEYLRLFSRSCVEVGLDLVVIFGFVNVIYCGVG